MDRKLLYVIGIGYRPLNRIASSAVLSARRIFSSQRLYDVFSRYDEFERVKANIVIFNSLEETIGAIREYLSAPPDEKGRDDHPVFLADGDPMFYGPGIRMVEEFGAENVIVLPDLSSMQVAFSRIGEPWGRAFLLSLHGGPDPDRRRALEHEIEEVPALLLEHRKLGIITDRVNTPSAIARVLTGSALFDRIRNEALSFYVCERLGYTDERIMLIDPEKSLQREFAHPNVVILLLKSPRRKNL